MIFLDVHVGVGWNVRDKCAPDIPVSLKHGSRSLFQVHNDEEGSAARRFKAGRPPAL